MHPQSSRTLRWSVNRLVTRDDAQTSTVSPYTKMKRQPFCRLYITVQLHSSLPILIITVRPHHHCPTSVISVRLQTITGQLHHQCQISSINTVQFNFSHLWPTPLPLSNVMPPTSPSPSLSLCTHYCLIEKLKMTSVSVHVLSTQWHIPTRNLPMIDKVESVHSDISSAFTEIWRVSTSPGLVSSLHVPHRQRGQCLSTELVNVLALSETVKAGQEVLGKLPESSSVLEGSAVIPPRHSPWNPYWSQNVILMMVPREFRMHLVTLSQNNVSFLVAGLVISHKWIRWLPDCNHWSSEYNLSYWITTF